MTSVLFRRNIAVSLIVSMILSAVFALGGFAAKAAAAEPLTLTATQQLGNSVKLQWNTANDPNGTIYRYSVYYQTTTGAWELMAANLTGTTYIAPSIDNYWNEAGGYKDYYSDELALIPFKVVATNLSNTNVVKESNVAKPTLLALTGGTGSGVAGGIQLQWDAVANADYYYVYGTDADGQTLYGPPQSTETNSILTTKEIKYWQPPAYALNKWYYFRIGAVSSDGEQTIFPQVIAVYTGGQHVMYQFHLGYIGWTPNWATDVDPTYTSASAYYYPQAIKIKLSGGYLPPNAHITYIAHVQDYGWLNWVSDGAQAGTTNQSRRMEAIQIKLQNMPGAHVEYRANVEGLGWQGWVRDGATAGTTGQSRKLVDLQIRIVY
ncbi:MAG: hypothetical protein J7559_20130 [Cohnella sp.]|nr:hypothetical protein [Cohnella sp.]